MTLTPARTMVFTSYNEMYDHIIKMITGSVADELDQTANLANAAAVIWQYLPDINWAGFYVFDPPELVLGPFQGKPAINRIKLGHGVCGTAAKMRKTIIVPDISVFEGHIACDPDSRSEIVVPMFQNNYLLGVLDIDSPTPNRFTEADRIGLERVAALLMHACDWSYTETKPTAFG